MTHICVGNLTINGSDNGLSPGGRQAITWTNVGILLIGPLGTNFSEMLIENYTFLFKKINLKMSSGKWRPSCLGHNVLNSYSILTVWYLQIHYYSSWNGEDYLKLLWFEVKQQFTANIIDMMIAERVNQGDKVSAFGCICTRHHLSISERLIHGSEKYHIILSSMN